MLLNSWFWGSNPRALRDLGKLRELAIVNHAGLVLVGKADVSFPRSPLAALSASAFGSSLSTHPPTGLLFTEGCRRICSKNK